jgi:DNA-binding XRE family transcriptional regulator
LWIAGTGNGFVPVGHSEKLDKMITAAQLRAARGLVDWTRNELAKAASISPETVKNIEHGIFRPQEETSDRIVKTFAAHGVVFTDSEGVKISKELVRTFAGKDGYIQFLDDICDTMRHGGHTCQFNFSDSLIASYGGEHIKTYTEKMGAVQGLEARCLVPEGDINFPVKHCAYRWLGKAYKDAIPFYLYNNKIAVLASGPDQDITFVSIYSETLAKAYYKQFEIYWEKSEPVPIKHKVVK